MEVKNAKLEVIEKEQNVAIKIVKLVAFCVCSSLMEGIPFYSCTQSQLPRDVFRALECRSPQPGQDDLLSRQQAEC